MPTILERLACASAELQHAYDAAKQQERLRLAAAIRATQLALNACYRLLGEKAGAA